MSVLRKEDDALRAISVYLKNVVERNEGIPLTRLQGMLSQLSPKARGNFSASPATIRLVTRKFPDTIFVDTDDKVYSCLHYNEPAAAEPSKPTSEDDIIELCNVYGVVQYLAPSNVYGFIMVNYPVKAYVFFDRRTIEGGKHKDLRKSNVNVGSTVLLSAVRSPAGHKAKFQATCVKCYEGTTVTMPADSPPSPEPPPQASDSDMIFNRTGFIHSVKFNHGFIAFGPKRELCAFFHRNKVKKTMLKPNQKLSDVFAEGDTVLFNARPSSRCNKAVKWQATMVIKIVEHHDPSQDDDGEDDEVFMSGDESEIVEWLDGYEREDVIDDDAGVSAVEHANWELSSCRHPEPSNTNLCTGYSAGRKLLGTEGTLFPDSATTALVFCLGLDTALVVEIGVVYHHGRRIKSFNDVLSDGAAEVLVDAVEVASNVWAATLVWMGERPLRHYREDVPNLTQDAARLSGRSPEAVGRDGICMFSSVPVADCPVVAYKAARGTVLRVEQCSAVCAVQEPGRLRRLEFTCFYRNGTAYYRNLNQVLQEGAAVSVNYMVGVADDGNEKVYCGLVWQGLTPLCVDQLSMDEFSQMLNIIDVQPEAPLAATDFSAPPQEVQSQGNAVHGSRPSAGSAVAPVRKQATSFALPPSVAHLSSTPVFIPKKSTPAGKQGASKWGQERVQGVSVSVDEASPSRTSSSSVLALPTVSPVPATSPVESSPMLTAPTVPSTSPTSHVESSPVLTLHTAPFVPTTTHVEPSPVLTLPTSISTTSHAESSSSAESSGVQNGVASWKMELTDDCFSMDEEITLEELNELFEEDDEVMMLGHEGDWRGREENEEVAPCDPTQSVEKEQEAWTPRLDAGDAGGKVDVGEQAGTAAAQPGSEDTEVGDQQVDIQESALTGPDKEVAVTEEQAPEGSSQQASSPETDTVSGQQSRSSPEEVEVERASAAVEEDVPSEHNTLTGEMFTRIIGEATQEVRGQLQDLIQRTVVEVAQRLMTERRDVGKPVDGSGTP